MLVFSAITPHPPLLIPTIGQDSLGQVKKTRQAMEKLAEIFYHAQPEVVIVISPHGRLMENAFTINTSPEFEISFKQFGDFETELRFKGDTALAYQIKEAVETKLSMQMIADENLDHGVGVPIYYLIRPWASPSSGSENSSESPIVRREILSNLKIIPLGYSLQDNKLHFELGQELSEIIHHSKKRIAVVASGDLSHVLIPEAPAGYSPQGKKFDKKLVDLIKSKKVKEILNLDRDLISEAAECGLKSIIILLGILSEHNFNPEVLSYEGPFGVGYLVCNFGLNS